MRTMLILAFLAFYQLGNAQLIDPFGKVVTHEIKMTKKDDGTFLGAMEWTTGGIDSLQKFVVRDLDVKAPVMVRIISKAPDHNIDLSFHKKKWDKVESKISTNGEKFADKLFRTMGMAGIGVSSKVAGIPYLIIVRVGLQFPSTKSLIRVTDDKEEYARHMKKLGYTGNLFSENEKPSSLMEGLTATDTKGNNMLLYVIIGLLALIIVLLAAFLLQKQKHKNTTVLFAAAFFSCYTVAQTRAPKLVPIDGQAEPAVFMDYSTTNVANQNAVPVDEVMNTGVVEVEVPLGDGTFIGTRLMRLDTAPGIRELTGEEAAEVHRRMQEANEEFDRQYREQMPGEETEGNQRIPSPDQTREELNQLRRQVRELQRQVELLSQEDEEYEEEENDEEEIVIYCEQRENCLKCIMKGYRKFMKHHAYLTHLQNFYRNKRNTLAGWIAYGDSQASVSGAGLGWGPIRMHKVIPAMEEMEDAYLKKFDEYIKIMEDDLTEIEECYGDGFIDHDSYANQVFAMIERLKATQINDYQ